MRTGNLIKSLIDLEYGGDFVFLETMQFVPDWTNFHIANGIELDIMTEMKGLENLTFEECYEMAYIAELDTVKVPFLHINHLIQNKKIVNRPIDKVDVIELEIIKHIRENSSPKS